jgi:rod shape-determining protein MreD
MNWIAFFILSYVTVALQSALTPVLRYGSSEPNLGLIALVFIALNAERDSALLGCFILGAMQDLATRQPFGLFAFSYGLAAMTVIWAARSVYREHPLTHFSCALLAGFVTTTVIDLHARFHRADTAAATFSGVIYTAILAPFVIGLLQSFKELFGFKRRGLRTGD